MHKTNIFSYSVNIQKIQKAQIYEKNDINKIKLEALNNYSKNLKEINDNILNLKEEIDFN